MSWPHPAFYFLSGIRHLYKTTLFTQRLRNQNLLIYPQFLNFLVLSSKISKERMKKVGRSRKREKEEAPPPRMQWLRGYNESMRAGWLAGPRETSRGSRRTRKNNRGFKVVGIERGRSSQSWAYRLDKSFAIIRTICWKKEAEINGKKRRGKKN